MNTAILLSGGIGSRIHTEVPKQYVRIGGKMLITYALRSLLASPFIEAVQIVAEPEWRELISADAKDAGLALEKLAGFADPGRNRQCSILNGLQSILSSKDGGVDWENVSDTDTVFIHDAARPLLSGKLIEECYVALEGHDGVMPVLPMKDTVYLSGDGKRVDELLDRNSIFAGQAPELFCLKKYYRANMELLPDRIMEINGSTEPALLAGMDIVIIPGDEYNFKITTEADLKRFQEIVRGAEV